MEIPRCPDRRHKNATVVRAGWYGRAGQRRQRWWCRPKNGEPHRFTETLPRIVDTSQATHQCQECATTLAPWEGQPAPRLYGFTARHIAWALAQVAAGATYRGTAATVREMAGRELDTQARTNGKKHLPPATQHGQLVSDWVEVFAPVIWNAYAPRTWPDRLLLDEDQFRYSTPGAPRGALAFYVLGALGYTATGRPYLAAVQAVPKINAVAWQRFLRSMRGQPQRVVTDGGIPASAAAKVWPTADLRRCEWHLAKNLSDPLPREVRDEPVDPLNRLLHSAQRSVDDWNAYLAEVTTRAAAAAEYTAAKTAADRLDPLIRNQAATRDPQGPHSIGPLEEFFHGLELAIGDRAGRMTNKRRADALLMLLAAHRNGWVNEHRWATLIREHLTVQKGRAPEQRKHTDPAGSPSLR